MNSGQLPLTWERECNINLRLFLVNKFYRKGALNKIKNYDRRLKQRSRENRKNETVAEKIIWNKLLRKKMMLGYKFTRQKPIDFFILDFYCSELLLGLEIDGEIHNYQKEYDFEREKYIENQNIKIIRFTNEEVLYSISKVKRTIEEIITERAKELNP